MIGISIIIWKKKKKNFNVLPQLPRGCRLTKAQGTNFVLWTIRRKNDIREKTTESEKHLLFFDGYVTNFSELSSVSNLHQLSEESEASLILKGYEKDGIDFLERLNGIFNIVIVDLQTENTIIFNDRYGLLHLYCGENKDLFVFSPDILYVAETINTKDQINLNAIADFLNFEFVIGHDSFFKKLSLVPSASKILINSYGIMKMEKYWDYPYSIGAVQSFEDSVNKCDVLIEQAISRILRLTSRPALSLSGGLDSRTIAGYLNLKHTKFDCYNLGFKRGFCDTIYSKMIAERINVPWHFFDFMNIDYVDLIPEALNCLGYHISYNQCSFYPIFRSERVQDKNDVILDGMCLDAQIGETFSAFTRGEQKTLKDEAGELLYDMFFGIKRPFAQHLFEPEFVNLIVEGCKRRILTSVEHKIDLPLSQLSQYYCFITRVRRYTVGVSLINRYSLDTQFPFYDNDFFDFVLQLRPDFRKDRYMHKVLLMKKFPELAAIPWEKTGLPVGIKPCSIKKKIDSFISEFHYLLNRLTYGHLELGKNRFTLDWRFRNDKQFNKFCIDVLKTRCSFDRYLKNNAIEDLIRFEESGRNYIGLILSLVQVKLFFCQLESG
ncbi:MAG: hypothetical protein HF982_09375 [Desulfobacteraceae bacterium]|nr:hypothetical protein [Desulfobacteraceae bacterium]MBC2719780.1 hypothetical protein [Desulfobacteraceae bacterium]